jgi:hypothetical protein
MSTVQNIIDSCGDRLETANVDSLYPHFNRAIRLVAKRLSLAGGADTASVSLPSDFWGLFEDPWFDGIRYRLRPLPPGNQKVLYDGEYGEPRWYEVKGTTIYFIPGNTAAGTLKGDYFQKPAALSAGTDTIPYNEEFDDMIEEFLIESVKINPVSEPELRTEIFKRVDEHIIHRDRTAANEMTIGIDWDYL